MDGVSLSDFESFIEHFLRALREFDRSIRHEPQKKPGRPERRAKLITAFRLIRFEPGSGVATIEPVVDEETDDPPLFADVPPSLSNLRLLTAAIEEGQPLSEDVIDALDRARRAAGEDGSIGLLVPGDGVRETRIDRRVIESLPKTSAPIAAEVTSVSGRLHLVDLEPDRIAIRTSDGVEWVCSYPEALEQKILRLIGEIVWVTGSGRLSTPKKGTMQLDGIAPVFSGEQTALFTRGPVPMGELLARGGIEGPQGLEALADDEWIGDDADEAYIAALFDDDER